MILPVNLISTNSVNKNYANTMPQPQQQTVNKGSNELKLSGYNSPMKSYAISFGWCDAHYQAMYEIDEMYTKKIQGKLKEIENLKKQGAEKHKRYSIVDNAALEAAKIMASYVNKQCVIAEVPPSYAIMTAQKFKQAMQESETFTNPVSALTAINDLAHMNVKNDSLDAKHLERAKGSTQLYAMAALLDQVEENKNRPEFAKNKADIDELTGIVRDSLREIYGDDIFDRIKEFGSMGLKPTDEQKAAALDFLVEVDAYSKNVSLPDDFQDKLQALLDKQSDDEGRDMDADEDGSNSFTIKVQYPDHEHTLQHAHGIPHTHHHDHEHEHVHEHVHTDENKYQDILDKMHSQKTEENTNKQTNEEEKEKKYNN